jgi:hypothetical protein
MLYIKHQIVRTSTTVLGVFLSLHIKNRLTLASVAICKLDILFWGLLLFYYFYLLLLLLLRNENLLLSLDLSFNLCHQRVREHSPQFTLSFLTLLHCSNLNSFLHPHSDESASPIHYHPLAESQLWLLVGFKLKCEAIKLVHLFTIGFDHALFVKRTRHFENVILCIH